MPMVDVTDKPVVPRSAEAAGRIQFSPTTIKEIKSGRIRKGDPLLVAEVAELLRGRTSK